MACGERAGLTPQPVTFVEARPSDWPGIWEVFREVVRSGDTYAYAPDIEEATAREIWMRDGPGEVTFVARDGESWGIVGSALLRPNQPGLGDHVANAGWMIAPAWQGRGIGRRFAEFVLDEARDRGFTAMQFNSVVTTNLSAIRLWESLGFEVVGRIPEAFRHSVAGLTDVLVMYRRI